jgi:F0F1-type ATP synthase delta subunit
VSSGATGLAGRYAGALYALAIESKKIDAIHADLTALVGLVVEY